MEHFNGSARFLCFFFFPFFCLFVCLFNKTDVEKYDAPEGRVNCVEQADIEGTCVISEGIKLHTRVCVFHGGSRKMYFFLKIHTEIFRKHCKN